MSTAFDDLSSLSEDEDESNEFKKFATNIENTYNYQRTNGSDNCQKQVNGLTSTPRLQSNSRDNYQSNFWSKSNGNHFNISDILEDEEKEEEEQEDHNNDKEYQPNSDNDLSLSLTNMKINGHFDDRNNSLENKRSETKQESGTDERSFSQRHVQLLIEENQRLSNELIVSQQRLSAINGNYEGLQYKLKELDKMNAEKENQLVRLEAKIRSLELNITIERENKEEVQRKLAVCESTVESLQYQLREIGKSDCLVRAQDTHESVVNCLKAKHENEIILLKGEIEGLRHELNSKNNEINSLNKELDQKKVENNGNNFKEQLKDMIKVCKDMWEQEMKERVENDMKTIIEFHEKKWTKSAEQELFNEKNKWEQELQTEVFQLTEFLKIKAKVSAGTLPERVSLRFVPLMNLWNALEESYDSKEESLRIQIEKLKEAKQELEEALNESRHNRSSSPTNGQSNDHIFQELRNELQKVNEEAILMKQKLNKYKQHYHRLVKRHDNEIQRIKEEFADILQTLKPEFK